MPSIRIIRLSLLLGLAATARGEPFRWSLAADGAWDQPRNWTPGHRFPNAAGDVACISNGSHRIDLGAAPVTVGTLWFMAENWAPAGHVITSAAETVRLVMDNAGRPARIGVLGERWSGAAIHAGLVLRGDLEIATHTAQNRYHLTLGGPIEGSGRVLLNAGRLDLRPRRDTRYTIPIIGGSGSAFVRKSGPATATLSGVHAVALSGDWSGSPAIQGGGSLVIDGILTNLSQTGNSPLFLDEGNRLAVIGGGQWVSVSETPLYYRAPRNRVVIEGGGSRMAAGRLLLDSRHGALLVTNGGRFEVVYRGLLGVTGSSNDVRLAGGAAGPATLDLKGRFLLLGGGRGSVANRVVVDAGGIITNGQVRMGNDAAFAVRQEVIVTNGGRAHAVGGVGNPLHGFRQSLHNRLTVAGSGSCWDNRGEPFMIAPVLAESEGTALDNIAAIADGGCLTNCSLSIGATPVNESGPRSIVNGLVVTNGGRVFCKAESYIGHGRGRNGADAAAISNFVWVAGGAGQPSVLDMGGSDLTVGYLAESGLSYANRLAVGAGGSVTAVGTLTIGSPRTFSNQLALEGGTVSAASFTLGSASVLSVTIGVGPTPPLTISGSAAFSADSYLRPVAPPGSRGGSWPIVKAAAINDAGLMLDPRLDAGAWRFGVTNGVLTVTYSP